MEDRHGRNPDDRRPADEGPGASRGSGRSSADDGTPGLVVGLGASAGGLRPLTDFLDHLDEVSGAAFVVVQHLDPDRSSTTPEILRRHTSIPVRRVEDGDALRPGHVYVNPPGSRIAVEEGRLRLSSAQRERGRPTIIDHFFRSLAEDQRDRSVAVVLSGTGSDGSVGITWVREADGLTMVQEPESAEFRDMPENAIATGNVDVVLTPAELASYLTSYSERRAGHPVPDEQQVDTGKLLDEITGVLEKHTDVDFSLYKESTLLRRIERRFLMSDVEGLERYVAVLRRDPEEVAQLRDDLLIGVTSFFRGPDAFRALQDEVLRRLAERAAGEEAIRVWIPACGAGQEAYSVAALLSECLSETGSDPTVKIFATDVDENALARARQGSYPRGIAEEVPEALLRSYFEEDAGGYRVSQGLRTKVLFSKHNVLSDPPFSKLDLISCRNFAIYLRTEVQQDLFRIFHFALRSRGHLFLGGSESLGRRGDLFRTVEEGARIYQKRDVESKLPLLVSIGSGAASAVSVESRFGRPRTTGTEGKGREFERRLERELLNQLAPTSVVVNRNHEALYFHGQTGAYLEHPRGTPSHDILEMARPGLRRQLGHALRHAMQTGEDVSRQGVGVEAEGGSVSVDLSVRSLSRGDRFEDLFLVVFRESSAPEIPPHDTSDGDLEKVSADVVEMMERELRDTRKRLQATIEDVESSNEELRSMNEELQTANEELQTSREEARATNEELQTVNEELKEKVEQLRRTHSDLENLLRSTDIATVFVDRELRIKRFTPAATSIFRLQERDRGRALEDITHRLGDGAELDLVAEIEEVIDTLDSTQREVKIPEEGKWYTMRIMPYRTVDDQIEGAVLTFTDVTKLKTLEQARSKLVAVMEGMPDAIVGRDREGTITSWNQGARRIFGYTEEEAVGENIDLIVPGDRREELERHHREAAEGRWSEPVETVRVGKDGRPIDVSVNFSCVHDEKGEVVEIAGIARDITDRVEAQEAVERAHQRQTEFMAVLSHELRNPLAPMRHAIDLLKREDVQEPDRRQRAREILDRQAEYMSRLVDDLMDVARISSGTVNLELSPVDLVEIVRNTVQDYGTVAERESVRLESDLPPGRVVVTGDATRLAQVLGNLLDNACAHTPAGGSVQTTLFTEGGVAVVTVEDEGPGLTEEQIEAVFEPFHQDRETGRRAGEGLGLGLTVARRLVTMHGGTLTAESPGSGAGSTFRVELPLAEEDAAVPVPKRAPDGERAASEGAPPAEDAAGAKRVLIVEDYRDAAEMMATTLMSHGREVKIAGNVEEGLGRVREFRPSVVLCDVGLPGERDGYDLARSIRSDPELRDIRLVAITGFGTDLDRERAEDAGFDQHLTKPIGSDELLRAVDG